MNQETWCKHILSALTIGGCLLWCACPPAHVTGKLSSSPTIYRGSCPGVVTFNGTITSDRAQIVTYIFTRSGGAIDTQPKTLTFAGPGSKAVSTTWTLGGDALPYYAGWEAIKITNPSVVVSNQANFHLQCNPPANSALAAHGNVDWHINTANEFLFGENMAGTVTAGHHAPDTWSRTHIHVGLTNTSKYYYDKALVSSGADVDIPNGIDRTMLFFYAGHGNPTSWNTLGDSASQGDVRLANITGGGSLRYYWQCSCEVFAHGPETCNPPTTFSYACPDQFNGAADSVSMRNVFQRWGPALTSDLRMACGGSTEMYCHTQEVDRAWSDYGNGSVAHMFLDGFGEGGAYGVVPVCMTLGGDDITKTPLYDDDFTNAPNTSGNTHYYLMYPSGTQQANVSLSPANVPEQLQKFRLIPAPVPPRFSEALEKRVPPPQVTSKLLAGGKAKLERIPQTGALHIDSGKIAEPGLKVLSDKDYVRRAANFLTEQGLVEQETEEPLVSRYMTASIPVKGQFAEVRHAQAGVSVVYRRVIHVKGVPVEVLGAPGIIRVELDNGGAVLRVSKLWRVLEPIGSPAPAKSFEQAHGEAMTKLAAPGSYKLQSWKIGYRHESIKEGEDELIPVYQFAFIAVKLHDIDHPPELIEVPALKK